MSTLSRSLSYGGVALPAGAIYGGGTGAAPLGAAVAVALLGVVLLGARLYLGGVRLPSGSRRVARKAAAPAVVLLVVGAVVIAGVAPGPTGSADAASISVTSCTVGDVALGGLFTFLNPEDTCGIYGNADAHQDHIDAYAHGRALSESQNNYLVSISNFRDERRTASWTEGKLALVNALNNNSSLSTANRRANLSMAAYYHSQVNNYLQYYSQAASQSEYDWRANSSWVKYDSSSMTLVGFATVRAPLPGAGNATLRAPVLKDTSTSTTKYMVETPGGLGHGTWNRWVPTENASDSLSPNTTYSSLTVESMHAAEINNNTSQLASQRFTSVNTPVVYTDPTSSNTTTVIDAERYSNQLLDWRDDMYNNRQDMSTFADSVYASYQAGELNLSDILSPTDLASRAATNYNQTGSNAFVAAELANLGLAGDLNTSVTVETVNSTGANVTYNGTPFYTADDVSSFELNKTYDPANLSGTVYLAIQQNDSAGIITLNEGPFTFVSAIDPETGANLSQISMENYNEKDTNASDLQQELERLAELRDELNQKIASISAPSAPSFGGLGEDAPILIVVAAAVILLASRD